MKAMLRMMMSSLMAMMASPLDPRVKQENARIMNKQAGGLLFSSSPIPNGGMSQNKRRKLYRGSGHPKLMSRRAQAKRQRAKK